MVLDRRGDFVANLAPDNFELYEEGQKQSVAFFSRGDTDTEAQQLRLGLLYDTSGSMGEDIESRAHRCREVPQRPRRGARRHARRLRYRGARRPLRPERFPRLVERIRQRKPDGWTALYDALGIYLDGSHEQEGRKVLGRYTDGGDTRSAMGSADALEMLRASDVTMYAIGFLQHQAQTGRFEQQMQLQQIAADRRAGVLPDVHQAAR